MVEQLNTSHDDEPAASAVGDVRASLDYTVTDQNNEQIETKPDEAVSQSRELKAGELRKS